MSALEKIIRRSSDAEGLGADLRSLRKLRGLTLVQLSDSIGKSVGWLSQLERGISNPGISELKALASAFDVPVSFFFRNADAPANEQGLIVRAKGRTPLGNDDDGLHEELLSPNINGSFEMIRSVFAAGAQRTDITPRQTEDGGYIVSGTLELTIAGMLYSLNAGDSFQFRGQQYGWRNPGKSDCVVLWIIAPPLY